MCAATDSQAARTSRAAKIFGAELESGTGVFFRLANQLECLPREIPETGFGVRRNRAAKAQSTPRVSATSLHHRTYHTRVRFGAILLACTRRVTSCTRVRRTEVCFRIPSGERVTRVPGAESITVRWLPRSRRAGNRPRMRCSTSGQSRRGSSARVPRRTSSFSRSCATSRTPGAREKLRGFHWRFLVHELHPRFRPPPPALTPPTLHPQVRHR